MTHTTDTGGKYLSHLVLQAQVIQPSQGGLHWSGVQKCKRQLLYNPVPFQVHCPHTFWQTNYRGSLGK